MRIHPRRSFDIRYDLRRSSEIRRRSFIRLPNSALHTCHFLYAGGEEEEEEVDDTAGAKKKTTDGKANVGKANDGKAGGAGGKKTKSK